LIFYSGGKVVAFERVPENNSERMAARRTWPAGSAAPAAPHPAIYKASRPFKGSGAKKLEKWKTIEAPCDTSTCSLPFVPASIFV